MCLSELPQAACFILYSVRSISQAIRSFYQTLTSVHTEMRSTFYVEMTYDVMWQCFSKRRHCFLNMTMAGREKQEFLQAW